MAANNKKSLAGIIQCYNSKTSTKTFKPENYQDIPRVLGTESAIDMNRLVCTHQQHVASAYMRRIRKDKIRQRDDYFHNLQNIPMKIKRMAVGPDYTDPYTNLKRRLPKLGHDNKIQKTRTPPYPGLDGCKYVPHNSLAPHMNVLFKMNPAAAGAAGAGPTAGGVTHVGVGLKHGNHGKHGRVEDELPFPPSPRRAKLSKVVPPEDTTPRKRFSVDMTSVNTKVKDMSTSNSKDCTPRCPTNSPRNTAFWSFNVPRELNQNTHAKAHVSSIPTSKNALAAISSVQKYNKPLPAIAVKA